MLISSNAIDGCMKPSTSRKNTSRSLDITGLILRFLLYFLDSSPSVKRYPTSIFESLLLRWTQYIIVIKPQILTPIKRYDHRFYDQHIFFLNLNILSITSLLSKYSKSRWSINPFIYFSNVEQVYFGIYLEIVRKDFIQFLLILIDYWHYCSWGFLLIRLSFQKYDSGGRSPLYFLLWLFKIIITVYP